MGLDDDEWPSAEEFRFSSAPQEAPDEFSPAEIKVMDLVAQGWSNAAIAKRLKIQDKSVDRRLHDIYRKMNLSYKSGGKSIRVAAVLRWLGLDAPLKWRVWCELCRWREDDLDTRKEAVAKGHVHSQDHVDEYAFRVQGLRK